MWQWDESRSCQKSIIKFQAQLHQCLNKQTYRTSSSVWSLRGPRVIVLGVLLSLCVVWCCVFTAWLHSVVCSSGWLAAVCFVSWQSAFDWWTWSKTSPTDSCWSLWNPGAASRSGTMSSLVSWLIGRRPSNGWWGWGCWIVMNFNPRATGVSGHLPRWCCGGNEPKHK